MENPEESQCSLTEIW